MIELKKPGATENVAVPPSEVTVNCLSPEIEKPRCRRDTPTPGIVRFGVRNSHRAHLAWYLRRLMQQGQDCAIVGAGVRSGDAAIRKRLLAQDCLTTLIEPLPDGPLAEICGSMIGFLPVEEANGSQVAQMAGPSTGIVSLTVTESGYFVNPATGTLDQDHPDIVLDVAHPETPRMAFGAIVAALAKRRAAGAAPFTNRSRDNLRGNGDMTRSTVVTLARLRDPELAGWIDAGCSFPNSMADCIAHATGPAENPSARARGVDDAAPVTHEDYRQWVIEDDFCAGRPNWDEVGATFGDSVHDHESMKIRILNADHQVLANAGKLLSVGMIAECMARPRISALFRKVQHEGVAAYAASVPGMTQGACIALFETRFSNPAIRDTTRRVALDDSARHAGSVLPILRDALAAVGPVAGLSLAEALWLRMCAGTREDGSAIEPNDPGRSDRRAAAEAARLRPSAWLEQQDTYGSPVEEPRFVDAFKKWLCAIWPRGTAAAPDRCLCDG